MFGRFTLGEADERLVETAATVVAEGDVFTVTLTAALVTLPYELITRTEYSPPLC
jgi:carbonic anhydrase